MKNDYTEEQKKEICDLLDKALERPMLKIELVRFKKDKGLMPSLEVGKWYKINNGIACYQGVIDGEDYIHYGFHGGTWNHWCMDSGTMDMGIIEATNEEVETALIAEAKRRGFVEGAKFESVGTHKILSTLCHGLSYDSYGLYYGGNDLSGVIFNNGVWATIIDEPQVKELTLSDIEKEFGCKVKIIK